MAKPTDLARWGTAASAVIVPSEAQKTTGWLAGDRPPAKILNYLGNRAYGWFQYLSALHDEPDFLNKVYRWTGEHFFLGSARLYSNLLYLVGSTAEVYYVNSEGAPTYPTREILISPLAGKPQIAANWFQDYAAGAEVYTLSPLVVMSYDIPVPSGCYLRRVSAGLYQSAAASSQPVILNVTSTFITQSPPFTTSHTSINTHPGSLTSGDKLLSVDMDVEANRSFNYFTAHVHTSDAIGQHRIKWIVAEFGDIGPRNY